MQMIILASKDRLIQLTHRILHHQTSSYLCTQKQSSKVTISSQSMTLLKKSKKIL